MNDPAPIVLEEKSIELILVCPDSIQVLPSCISAISTLIVIIASFVGRFWTRPLSTMIFVINTADFIFFASKVSVLFFDPDSDMDCIILQAIGTFCLIATASWAVLFGHAFYQILKNKNTNIVSSLLKYYIPVSFILPVLTGLSTFLSRNTVLRKRGVCVYRVSSVGVDWFILFHLQLPLLLTILLCIVCYILSYSQLKRIVIEGNVREALTLIVYPAILIFCWGPHVALQIMAENGVKTSDAVQDAFRVFPYLMGFLDALVYGEGVKGTLRKYIKTCRRKRGRDSNFSVDTEQTGETLRINYKPLEEPPNVEHARVTLEFIDSYSSNTPNSNWNPSL